MDKKGRKKETNKEKKLKKIMWRISRSLIKAYTKETL